MNAGARYGSIFTRADIACRKYIWMRDAPIGCINGNVPVSVQPQSGCLQPSRSARTGCRNYAIGLELRTIRQYDTRVGPARLKCVHRYAAGMQNARNPAPDAGCMADEQPC